MSIRFQRESQVRADIKAGEPVKDLPALIRVAVADSNSLDRKKYYPYAYRWHALDHDGDCNVCLAGSVLAGTVGIDRSTESISGYWKGNESLAKVMVSLDMVRQGEYMYAFLNLGWKQEDLPQKINRLRKPSPYLRGFSGWKEYRELLAHLSEIADEMDEILGLDNVEDVVEFSAPEPVLAEV